MCNDHVNHGAAGDNPGEWVYDEFLFDGVIWGRALVEYTAQFHKVTVDGRREYEGDIVSSHIVEVVLFDDDGNEIPLTDSELSAAKIQVLKAFLDDEESILDHEHGELISLKG